MSKVSKSSTHRLSKAANNFGQRFGGFSGEISPDFRIADYVSNHDKDSTAGFGPVLEVSVKSRETFLPEVGCMISQNASGWVADCSERQTDIGWYTVTVYISHGSQGCTDVIHDQQVDRVYGVYVLSTMYVYRARRF